MSRRIDWPLCPVAFAKRLSGGNQVLTNNLVFAASVEPKRFSMSSAGGGTPLVSRNTVPLELLARGNFVYMPQNAWAWLGPGGAAREAVHRLALRLISEIAFRRSAAVVRISEAIPNPKGASAPVLHNVLDPQFEDALVEARNMSCGLTGSILSVGSLVPYRNFERLIEAHDAYRRNGGRLKLVMAGPPTFPRALARLQRLVADRSHVELRPERFRRAEVLAMLRECDVAILPSLVEASPVSVLEALVLCPKVLASRIPGHLGIAGGFLDESSFFDPSDTESMCRALLESDQSEVQRGDLMISTPAGRSEARMSWLRSFIDTVSQLILSAETG